MMGRNFLDRSLKNAFDFFKEAVFSEDIASHKGLLQSVDPRIKFISLIIILVITSLARSISALVILYFISVILALLSGISILYFIKRVWFFIPIFALVIAIPAVFMSGIFSATIFVLRVATCVSFAVLMTITTKHARLFKSLRTLKVPGIFIDILDMMYRYIFLFMKAFEEMHLSLKSRLIRQLNGKEARYWIASRISFLFNRSLRMSEDVYRAMVARGYRRE